jgi:hypothetical protein
MNLSDVPAPVWSLVASFAGAWLAARFALRRFYDEKIWERKTGAYTAIFEALYEMHLWFDAHIEAEQRDKELSKEQQDALSNDYQIAKRKLQRRLASEAWLIPDDCRLRINEMLRALNKRPNTWFELLENHSAEIEFATIDLARMVRTDLRLRLPNDVSRMFKRLFKARTYPRTKRPSASPWGVPEN